ncbi:MAG TPA: aminoacyl-tRNA hydrolase [bacterium]|nr:aminoacyl-tRNA hydrolase [bacterium]
MIIIVGLGNPGKKYQKTRHNIGFIAINNLQSTIDNFSDWKFQKKFNAEISKGIINNKNVILVKPQTFMNNSGQAVKAVTNFYKTKDLIVIHDDIDLSLGRIKISKARGSAGHNGVQSIIDILKIKNLIRLRIGIANKTENQKLENFVLKNFSKIEENILKEVIKKTIEAINTILKENLEKAMNRFNEPRRDPAPYTAW